MSFLPEARVGSSGPDVVEFAESLGYSLFEWQRWVIDGIFSEDRDLNLCASLVLLLMPRQNGKNLILEVVELYAFYVLDYPVILHTAHLAETSASHMENMRAVIEANPQLDAITTIFEANGKERIFRTDTRAVIRFVTRSKKIGRGRSPRLVILDEALFLTDEQLNALLPSLSAQSMKADSPQIIYTSSAPLAESHVLHRVRRRCVAGSAPSAFVAEWSCDPASDIADRANWYEANPSMGLLISEQWVFDQEFVSMMSDAFGTERLGIVQEETSGSGVISAELWESMSDPSSQCADPLAVALDVSPDRAWASFGVAGLRADGLVHVEVIDRLDGTADLVATAKKIAKSLRLPIIIDARSPAAGLADAMRAAGVAVTEIDTQFLVRSCAAFQDACQNRRVRHIGQTVLDLAVRNASVRPVGESWAWSRRSSSIDISSLMVVTLAHGAITQPAARKPVFAY